MDLFIHDNTDKNGAGLEYVSSDPVIENVIFANNSSIDNDGHLPVDDQQKMLTTGADVYSLDVTVLEFSLAQNYPNPFNATTTIEFSIIEPGFVTLKVYNMLGQTVATLVSREMSSGLHRYQWHTSGVASGHYFYRLSAGGQVLTRRLLLLK